MRPWCSRKQTCFFSFLTFDRQSLLFDVEPPNTNQASVKEAGDKSPNKKKDLCRFYARGHCTKKGDCRFDHPSICKVFRQFGDKTKDPKGCDGKCEAFHPNVCLALHGTGPAHGLSAGSST